MEKARKGETYILGNNVVSFKEFANLLHEESGCPKVEFK